MPNPPIALLARNPASGSQWLQSLSAALAGEELVPFSSLTPKQRQAVEIAIVADPDPAEVAQLLGLVWIQSLWAGVERLVNELGENAPPIVRLKDPELARTMAEAVLAWTYYLHRDMPHYYAQQQQAIWTQRPYVHPKDMTVGLLGLGALGSAAAHRLRGAGFGVAGWSRTTKADAGFRTFSGSEGLSSVLAMSDVVVCLLPLTADTRGLIDSSRLSEMKAGAALINFGRGPVVPADELIKALDSGHVSHAVLDVFDEEPLPATSGLWSHPKVTVLPHISAPTNRETATRIVADNIRSYRETGAIPGPVDRELGY
jgi:glyoxylate/hydroxypyruvate reductase